MMSSAEDRARGAQEAKDFDKAYGIWWELAMRTRDSTDFCRAASAASSAGRWEDSENAYLRALDLDPLCSEAMLGLGLLYSDRTDQDSAESLREAKEWYLRALRVDRSALGLGLLGITCAQLEDFSCAKEALREAILRNPEYAEAYLNLGWVLRDENPSGAVQLLEKAIDLDPEYFEAHQDLGKVLHRMGNLVQAEYHFRRCIEIDEEDYFAHLFLANNLSVQGRPEEAEKEFRAAISLRPEESDAYDFFANFLDGTSRTEEAKEVRARAKSLPPKASKTEPSAASS